MALSSISGAVLIGGRSRRMGVPKGLLRLEEGGPTFVELVVMALRRVVRDVVLIGSPPWPMPPALSAYPVVVDRGESAADGIVTALRDGSGAFVIVVGCDLPFLDAEVLTEMSDRAVRTRAGVVAADAFGLHPLHAVWARDQCGSIAQAVEAGQRSLGALTRIAGMGTFDLDAPEQSEAARWSVFNVNLPADLDRARAHAAGVL